MLDHPRGDPWSGATYHGFADAAAPLKVQPTPPRRRKGRGKAALLVAGFAVALAFGLALGLVARPELTRTLALAAAPPPAAAPVPAPAAIPISIPPAAVTEAPQVDAPPQGQADELALPEPPLPPRPLARSTPPTRARLGQPVKLSARGPASPAAAPLPGYLRLPPGMTEAQARADPSCADAQSGAEQMVCSDPQLAEADAEMARAYFRAREAGVPAADLRQQQRDWLAIREDAARHSRRAVASVYQQRLRELNDIAAAAESSSDDTDEDADQ